MLIRVGSVQFINNSAGLPRPIPPLLGRVARLMIKKPNLRVLVHGHADERGNEDRNMALSLDRANRVAKYLVSWRISARRITVRGFGSSESVDSGKTEGALAKNRRVEIIWVKSDAGR